MRQVKANVIIPEAMRPSPEEHEVVIAWILARHYNCSIDFLQPSANYKTKTPDIVMQGLLWEIKSPTGNSKKSTIEYQFKGLKQSRNLIIDGRRTKLADELIIRQISLEITKHSRVGKMLFISKSSKIIELR